MTLISEKLKKDPRVAQAKQLLLDALADHQKEITHVKPANPELRIEYEHLLNEFAHARGAKLYYPYIGSGIGNHTLVELMDGSIKYDFINGIGPHYWGHSHPDIVSSGIDAALNDVVMQGNLQQNLNSLKFMKILVEQSQLDHCFLTSSGVMANENGLKIALQKKHPASRILSFEHCFTGRSLAISQITDKPAYREGLPITYMVDYVPFFDPKHPEESTQRAVNTLKMHLHRYPKQHALMVFELIQGEGGFNLGSKEFFTALMKILKEEDILVLDDEIQTFGRLSKLFAFQHFELDSYVDIVTIGKLSQVCATLYRKHLTPRPGLLSQTFTGSSSAIEAGTVIIDNLIKGNFYGHQGKISQIHQRFVENFEKINQRHPGFIEGPYGEGTMIAFTPFQGHYDKVIHFVKALFEEGVISFIAGTKPTRVRFLVPAIIRMEEIDQACEIVEKVLISANL